MLTMLLAIVMLLRSANQRTMISAIMKKLLSSDIGTLTNTVSTLAHSTSPPITLLRTFLVWRHMFGIDIDKNVYSAAVSYNLVI